MKKALKDLPVTIAYLDDIIIYSKTAEDHLNHLQTSLPQTLECKAVHETEQMPFLCQRNPIFNHILSATGIKPLPSKMAAISIM